jgi:flagellar basal-body rod protein FlgB
MSWMNTPLLNRLEQFLDLSSYRQGLVSSNLANIDTPGYRTRDISFEDELRISTATAPAQARQPLVQEVSGLIERPDGNNVSVDRETMLLAQTQLQFRVGVELLRIELRRLQTAITEGK